ncbi:MAG: HTH-type transcriptional repressor AseR [Candidatus Dichloromethanomonas elyunquensis]|nr:MAG: HTH-type transcriptional repressor AseR [Candidatus Dichloromethanomonas elyunquensis]
MENFQEILKALADETRLKLVTLLLTHDFCVGALAKNLDISKAAVSQHLQLLRKAGVVKGEKRGYYAHYWVDREILKKAAENLTELASIIPESQGGCRKHAPGEHQCCRKEGRDDV